MATDERRRDVMMRDTIEDAIVPRLLSLRFHEFGDVDRMTLEHSLRNDRGYLVIPAAAREYLQRARDGGYADPAHLCEIKQWLESRRMNALRDVVSEFDHVIAQCAEPAQDYEGPRF
jgi:hypothetical protein